MQRKDFRAGIAETIEQLQPQYAVSLACNRTIPWNNGGRPVPGKDLQQCIRSFLMRLDRALLGPKWAAKADKRTHGLLLPEHLASNSHLHGALRVDPSCVDKFENALVDALDPKTGEIVQCLPLWKDVIPSGSSCIRRLSNGSGWSNYVTKETTDQDNLIIF